jgi:hypothetical protein
MVNFYQAKKGEKRRESKMDEALKQLLIELRNKASVANYMEYKEAAGAFEMAAKLVEEAIAKAGA